MSLIHFDSDYVEGCHPLILEKLLETNMEQTSGYGTDEYCESAREKIRTACSAPHAGVHFFVGGTQVNFTVIRSCLLPHQAVISPETGHINVHETGAVEATGHKIIAVQTTIEGKITAGQIEEAVYKHYNGSTPPEHTVQPKLVYISQPTENGALYSKEELSSLHDVCKKYGLLLFADGARLGYGLSSPKSDVELSDMANFCDAFTIGGTKCGALFGEAAVITNPEIDRDFRYAIKQNGAMLAKGRLLGIQFDTLFTGGLYFSICKSAVEKAFKIRDSLKRLGYEEYAPSPTNQQFFIIPDSIAEKLLKSYAFSYWETVAEGRNAYRICTSWATKDENVERLIKDIENLS